MKNKGLFSIIVIVIVLVVAIVLFVRFMPFQAKKQGIPYPSVTIGSDESTSLSNQNIITSSLTPQSDGALTKTITVDCSGYDVVQTSDNYKLVLVNGFDLLLVDEITPVLPVQEFTVELPLEAEINSINVSFTDSVALGNLNIPAYSSGDPMGSGGYYVNCPNNIGMFPANKYSYRVSNFESYREIIISLIPVDFNSSTKQVNLYKTNTITVSYTTPQKGILENAYTYKSTYPVGENIQANVIIKNITSSSANFTINASLEDDSGNVVAEQSKTQLVDAATTYAIPLSIPSYDKGGTYTLRVVVTDDGGSNIGEWKDIVNIVPFEIVNFNAPEHISQGDYGTFSMTLHNFKNQTALFYANIYIYDSNAELVAKLPQMSINMNAGEQKTVSTQWYPSNALKGSYSAYLVVTSADDNYSLTKSADVEIVTTSLTLTSPNGSESLTPHATCDITFSVSGDTSSIHYFVAFYTVDGGSSYEYVTDSSGSIIYTLFDPLQSIYSIPWYVPVRYSTMAKVVVYAMDINNKMLAFDVSDYYFKIADIAHPGDFSVSITKPLVGETVIPGTTYRIEWTTSGTTPPDLSYFVVFISYEDGRNDSWYNVCEEQHYYPLSNATYFDWNVPANIRSDMVKIVVYPMSLPNNFLVGNSTPITFKVIPPSYNFTISITHPLSGENLTALGSYNLQWTTANEPTELAGFFFYLSVDNGASWELLRTSDSPSADPLFISKFSSPYSYNWNVWKRLSNNCKLMTVAVDSSNISIYNILGIQISDTFNIIP